MLDGAPSVLSRISFCDNFYDNDDKKLQSGAIDTCWVNLITRWLAIWFCCRHDIVQVNEEEEKEENNDNIYEDDDDDVDGDLEKEENIDC